MPNDMTSPDLLNSAYAERLSRLPGQDLDWLLNLRQRAFNSFAKTGLPTQKLESWKYTSLRPMTRAGIDLFSEAQSQVNIDCAPSLLAESAFSHKIVFVDGHFNPALSTLHDLPEGVTLDSMAWLMASNPALLQDRLGQSVGAPAFPMGDVNAALTDDGLALIVEAGVKMVDPIEVIYLGGAADAPLAYHPRNLIVLGAGSEVTLIEHHRGLGDASYLSNLACEIELGESALLRHYKLQHEGAGAFHLANTLGRIASKASYDSFTLSIGARLSRNETRIRLEGEESECHLNGAYLMRGEQHCDNTTEIRHCVPNTTCREVFKGVIDDRARAVFQGRVVVEEDAQNSNGHQLSKALLLSERAEIDQKPELEIYADDVACSHGATAGDLDHEALFYLRSRGIPEDRARRLLIEAFLGEAIEAIAAEGLCPALMSTVGHWLVDA